MYNCIHMRFTLKLKINMLETLLHLDHLLVDLVLLNT